MGTGLSLQSGTVATEPKRGVNLSFSAGGGYGQLPVLYSSPTAYGAGNIHFEAPFLGDTRFYQEVTVAGGKDAFQGRYDAGISFENSKRTKFNVGAYASNDFNAPEFVAINNPENLTLATKAPIRSGLLQAGLTAGVEHPVSKNVALFAKADVANLSYSRSGECVNPVKSKSYNYINNVHTYELDNSYEYEKGVKSSVGASVEGGAKVSFGKLTVTGKAGYSTFQGANYGVGLTYNCNILGK